LNSNKSLWLSFLLLLVLTDLVAAAVAIFGAGYPVASREWMIALLIADVNAFAGFVILKRNFNKPINILYASVAGSTFARMAGLALVLWLALVKAGFSKFGFTIVLFVAYICKSVAEIFLLRKMNPEKSDKTTV
jgi:hypothetical protein